MNVFRSITIMISRVPPALLFAAILGIAAITAMLVTSQIESNRKDLNDKIEAMNRARDAQGSVVIALKDIPEGKPISSSDLQEKKLPQGKIPADALTSPAMASGRLSKYGISQGQIVSQHDLAPVGLTADFDSRLKKGMRAVTFAVDTNSGVAGFVTPESHVDILSMVGSGADTRVAPILSDAQVIAVGQIYQREPGSSSAMPANSVTVAITPEDAQKLVKAVAASKLYLSLRGQGDHTPLLTVDVTQLYPRKGEPDTQEQQVALGHASAEQIPPPPVVLEAPEQASNLTPQEEAKLPAVNSEIEMWSASSRQVVQVPQGRN